MDLHRSTFKVAAAYVMQWCRNQASSATKPCISCKVLRRLTRDTVEHGRPSTRRGLRGYGSAAGFASCSVSLAANILGLRRVCARRRASHGRVCFPEDMLNRPPVRAAYVHIPFCRQRCRYCDFPIDVVGPTITRPRVHRYLTCLKREILCGGAGSAEEVFESEPLQSLYFGGGTPSLLPASQLEELLTLLRSRFGFDSDCEITIEMDPGTFTEEKARELVSCGMVRASVGIQSLDDEILQRFGRGHTAGEAVHALRTLRSAGFENLSADILSGVPGQSREQLKAELNQLSDLGVDHLSVYDLQYEPGTDFARRFPDPGASGRPTEEVAAKLYETAHEELEALGFEHYEISNYARLNGQGPSPRRSRHNQTYWQRKPYAAFGNGAASFVGGQRATRPRKLNEYCDWIESGSPISMLDVDTSQRDDLRDAMFEAVMLGLRTLEGIDISAEGRAAQYLLAVAQALQPWEESGEVRMASSNSLDTCKLTAALLPPRGFLVSDAVLSDALAAILGTEENATKAKTRHPAVLRLSVLLPV